jgi:amidase
VQHTVDAGLAQPSTDIVENSIADLASKLASKKETSASLVDKYVRRINALNDQLHAVLEVNGEAPAIAKQLDDERAAGKLRGPLHGIPLLVKDNIDTGDKMMTTAGSLALDGSPAAKDAFVIDKLRKAGAIILGKTNLSEWANFRGMQSSSGWSARGGQCRNPYAFDRTASGSSSGSAAATAASMCPASLGSETDGSITSPASMTSLVGIKPTIGLVSRAGVIPIAISQDTVGPITRTVADAALILSAIAGTDPEDPATATSKPEDYTKYLDVNALKGARLGVPRKGVFGLNRNTDALMTTALDKLKELGAVLVDPVDFEIPPDLQDAELAVFFGEMKPAMEAYLKRRPDAKMKNLADIIAFNTAHADRELHLYGQEYLEKAQAAGGMTDKAYLDARAKCLKIAREQLDTLTAKNKLDAFVMPTGSLAWLIDPTGDAAAANGFGAPTFPAIAGYPHISVPAGDFLGLPFGLSLFGAAYSEGKLFGYAYAYEQATKHRRPPKYLPTAVL